MGTDSFEQLGIDKMSEHKQASQGFTTEKEHKMILAPLPKGVEDSPENRQRLQEYVDGSGKIYNQPILAVIDSELAMEAMQNNIFVLEDPYRTGFECKACDGKGHTDEKCKTCLGNKVVAQNSDFNVGAATLTEEEKKNLPPHFIEMLERKAKEQINEKIVSGGLVPCQKCIATDRRGGFEITGFEQCQICKGRGASLHVPQQAMNRPTSGKVVSTGSLCKFVQVGDRVFYSNMMGGYMNFKHKGLFRYMREDEIIGRLHGTNPEKFQRKLS